MSKWFKHLSILLLLIVLSSIVIGCGNSAVVDDETDEPLNIFEATTSDSSQAEGVSTEAATLITEATTEATTAQSDSANFNTIGGLPGNIANTSFWGFQDNTLYYTANYDLGVLDLTTGDISKIKNAAGNYYQMLGDYAFQSNLMGLNKINLKTGEIKNLTPDFAGYINAVDGWLYYINGKDKNTIYRVDIDGQNREKLSDLEDVSILL